MPIASPLIPALIVALVSGAAGSAWLWLVQHRKERVRTGLRALAAMRWRESSRFVIQALEAQGFSASRKEPDLDRGQSSDLLLDRDDQTWLLTFKQGVNYRVDRATVSQMAAAVRASGASGGVLATLGRVRSEARRHPQKVELIDGATLWPEIAPLLPPSLHSDVEHRARRRTVRATAVLWLLALVLGLGVYLLASRANVASPPTPVTTPRVPAMPQAAAPSPADLADVADPIATLSAPIPRSEQQQRDDIAGAVTGLPGVTRASWVTQSTLVAFIEADASNTQMDEICRVLAPYDDLRYSRVQLQPAPDSDARVRFLRCTWD